MTKRGFHNRQEAGEALAERLLCYKNDPNAVVLGLPRGGVVVAEAISGALSLPMDVLIARKLRAPCNLECALGAVTETGVTYIDENVLCMQNYLQSELRAYLEHEIQVQEAEILRQKHLFRRDDGLPDLKQKKVILVDDGIETGATFFAAVEALRKLDVASIAGAVPVGPTAEIREMHYTVDEAVVLIAADNFRAVRDYYVDFRQTSDDEVAQILRAGRREPRCA